MKQFLFSMVLGLVMLAESPLMAQTINPVAMGNLPASLQESSGLEIESANSIWSHNDSGGQPELYEIDSTGALLRTVFVQGASNIDWEDLTQDAAGNYYIGDFGNNSHNRTDLRIFKVGNPGSAPSDTLIADTLLFSYPDQTAFPPPDSNKNFDMEAMVAWGDSLYLFSKNWSDPFTGYTKLYRLPQLPGTYVAELIDSFYTGPGPSFNYQLTAGDLSDDGKALVLMGYERLWLFTCFAGTDFFGGITRELTFSGISQKEGICWKNEHQIYLTDEKAVSFIPNQLYQVDLSEWLPPYSINLGNDTSLTGPSLTLDAGLADFSYLWSTGDSSQTLTVDSSGTYWVTAHKNGVCSSSDTITVTFMPSQRTARLSENEIRLYPNPFNNTFEIAFEQPLIQPFRLKVCDLTGKIIFHAAEIPSGTVRYPIELAQLPAGAYFLMLENAEQRVSRLLVKNE